MNVAALPTQGQQTYRLIQTGGPFPYSRDGVVFQNREGVLPSRSRGTYHEYTVKTPGSGDRGARRIICATPPVSTGPECYYTADHYASFQRIRP
jgi:ribonuclease T1